MTFRYFWLIILRDAISELISLASHRALSAIAKDVVCMYVCIKHYVVAAFLSEINIFTLLTSIILLSSVCMYICMYTIYYIHTCK